MGKIIVITGGSDGLGKAIAENLSKENTVIIISVSKEKLERVANEIGCAYEVCDVSDVKQVQMTVNKIFNKYEKIDCLINNAGLFIQGKLEENDYEKIRQVIEVNTLGVIYMTKAVIPHMKQEHDGLIININSQAGIYYKAERTIYNASKWGVTGFSGSIQLELAQYGIRVTDVMPGKMKTDLFIKNGIEKNMTDGLELDQVTRLIEFIVYTDKSVVIPEVGIKHISN